MKRHKQKIRTSLIFLSTVPLLGFCIAALTITSVIIYNGLAEEVKYSLDILVHSEYRAYDLQYPGDYKEENGIIKKGGSDTASHEAMVDRIKELSGADATLFYGKTRHLTTIKKADGTRAVGSCAEPEVIDRVLVEGQEYFSDSVLVNKVKYFGYYMPIRNSDGTVVGMAFVGRPRNEVMEEIIHNIRTLCLLAAGTLGAVLVLVFHFSGKLIHALNETEDFLGKTAEGDLSAEIDPHVLERQDEIGEMGHFALVLQKSIIELVGKDPLTGLANRRSCDIVLKNLAEKNKWQRTAFTVVMADIDHFKQVNDTYGHQAGDEILKNIARLMTKHIEHLGFVFRWGGEEFLLIYEDREEESAMRCLEKLHQAIDRAEVDWEGRKIKISMTFGLADYNGDCSLEDLVRRADENLYKGKKRGRDQIVGREDGCFE